MYPHPLAPQTTGTERLPRPRVAATTSCHSKTRPWVARNRPVPSQIQTQALSSSPGGAEKVGSQGVRKAFSSQARRFLGTGPRGKSLLQLEDRDAPTPPESRWPGCEGICAGPGGAPLLTLSALRVPGRGPQLQGVLELESSGCAERGAPTRRKWGLGGAELSNPQTPRAVHYLNTS